MKNCEVYISSSFEVLDELYSWLSSDFDVIYDDSLSQTASLGDKHSVLKITFEFIEKNFQKFISMIKGWIENGNKDFELTMENGSKKISLKCPSRRISDDNIKQVMQELDGFFKYD